jgi:hypothetical protein
MMMIDDSIKRMPLIMEREKTNKVEQSGLDKKMNSPKKATTRSRWQYDTNVINKKIWLTKKKMIKAD